MQEEQYRARTRTPEPAVRDLVDVAERILGGGSAGRASGSVGRAGGGNGGFSLRSNAGISSAKAASPPPSNLMSNPLFAPPLAMWVILP